MPKFNCGFVANHIINTAIRTPYRKGHLFHSNGDLYMGRYGLFETDTLSARVHHIATADLDTVCHDHPWNFISIVLAGGYTELRPWQQEPTWNGAIEMTYAKRRTAGSIGIRRATDRHRITQVDPGTWTLFVYGRWKNDWGFYHHNGMKYWWRYYLDKGMGMASADNDKGIKLAGNYDPSGQDSWEKPNVGKR